MIEKIDGVNNKFVNASLSVNTTFHYKINYERYEVVYLFVIVEDVDQTIMPNSANTILVVRIGDENDNAPEFIDNTLEVPRRVFEEADEDTLIGNILAIDIDGPGNNIIQYSIR